MAASATQEMQPSSEILPEEDTSPSSEPEAQNSASGEP